MEVYESEKEQIEAIKKWWQENGKTIVIGAVLGLASLIGWQQWSASVTLNKELASIDYQTMMSELEAKNWDAVKERGAHLISEFGSTGYTPYVALALAKANVETGELSAARTYLQMVIDQKDQVELQHVARLRMARLLLAEDNASQALTLVNSVSPAGFGVAYDEVKGDIHAALGNTEEARSAYQRALDSMEAGIDQSILKLKLDNLGGSEAQS